MFREGWIVINRVPTRVLTWGGWIEDEIESSSILLCITGNPGVPDFYVTFLSTLHTLIQMPVWIVSFAGCAIPQEDNLSLPSLSKNPHLYNLSGQVDHKNDFIKRYIPPSKSIYLIGHSVGGKIVIDLLKREEVLGSQVKKAFLLFPTLEHISKTRNGKLVMNLLQYLIPLTIQLAWLFSMFPEKVRLFLLKIYFGLRTKFEIDQYCLSGGMRLINPKAMRGVFFLAMDEMKNINELDKEVLQKYSKKIECFYSKTDGWAPLEHYENIRKICPSVNAEVVEDHIIHAFVLNTPREVASMISRKIKDSCENDDIK